MSDNIYTTSYSWSRVAAYARYHQPQVRGMLTVYLLVSILACALLLLPVSDNAQAGIFTIMWTVLPYLMYFSPLVFTRGGDSRKATAMLPVTAGERLTYYMLFMFVAVPVSLYVIPFISYSVFTHHPSMLAGQVLVLVGLKADFTHLAIYLGGAENMAITMVCFLFVMRSHSNRTLKGIVSVFVTQIVCGIAGAIYGASGLMEMGVQDGASGAPMKSEQEIMAYTMDMMNHWTPGMIGLFIFFAAIFAVALWLSYRVLKRKRA